jgi:hypothetical protein
MNRLLVAVAIAAGLSLGYLDSRPGWDDAGVTAGLLFIASATFGGLAPQRPWLWAICVGAWIPIFGILERSNYGSVMALIFAFAGAYAGMGLRRAFTPA